MSPTMRSNVDFPQPDGPISDTNSPRSTSRSISCSAVTPPLPKTFVRLLIETTEPSAAHTRRSGARCTTTFSARRTTRKKPIPSSGGEEIRRPQTRRLEDVVLVEVEDRAAETVGDRGGLLADDRPDDARRRSDLQRREDVRKRGGNAKLPQNRPPSCRVRVHELERPGIRGQEPTHGVDGDREEREVGRDHGDPHPVGRRPAPDRDAAEAANDDRRQRQDGDGLRRDDVRHDASPKHVELRENHTEHEADDGAEQETDRRGASREERRVQEVEPQIVTRRRRLRRAAARSCGGAAS